MITIKQKGDFSNLRSFFERAKEVVNLGRLDEYGRRGVEALAAATPKNSGETANSWDYQIDRSQNRVSLTFTNSHINDGVNIAIILQYGHGTRYGGYVQGIDYINPSIRPIFEELTKEAWEEVTKS